MLLGDLILTGVVWKKKGTVNEGGGSELSVIQKLTD